MTSGPLHPFAFKVDDGGSGGGGNPWKLFLPIIFSGLIILVGMGTGSIGFQVTGILGGTVATIIALRYYDKQ